MAADSVQQHHTPGPHIEKSMITKTGRACTVDVLRIYMLHEDISCLSDGGSNMLVGMQHDV